MATSKVVGICISIGIASMIIGALIGGAVVISEMPPTRIGFNEPLSWAYIPDSNKIHCTMQQKIVLNFTKGRPDGYLEVDTILYILEFDFDVAFNDTDDYMAWGTHERDYLPPELYVNPLTLRMSKGQVLNKREAW